MEPIKLFIAGDSTAANYPEHHRPMAGWGEMLKLFMEAPVEIHNKAKCGRSARSFIHEGRLKEIDESLRPNDYLFIQFGHNDQKEGGGYADPETAYPSYLSEYVHTAHRHGAWPVLLTSVERRHFNEDGELLYTHGGYTDAVRKLAGELNVPMIDLQIQTRNLYEKLGPEESRRLFVWLEPGEHANYPAGVQDNTHFNTIGAQEVAELTAQEIARTILPIRQYVKL
jgi:lysophospholipase L1-like esterase